MAMNTSAKQILNNPSETTVPSYTLSVAPMMDWTDRHCRYLFRQFSRCTLLYTEMITAPAIVYGDAERHLVHNPIEHPLALQIGGSKPNELAQAVMLGNKYGFKEINLNMGCPSGRVANGCFGAKLMTLPELASDCVKAMLDASDSAEITVKCRIGVDDDNPNQVLPKLIERFSNIGIKRIIIHARKAYLNGLNPKENRTIPPLNYGLVYAIKKHFSELDVCINGGITDLGQVTYHLGQGVDGVMVGRAAYQDPIRLLSEADTIIYGQPVHDSLDQALAKMVEYIDQEVTSGTPIRHITRHMLGLFTGQRGAKIWRRNLSSHEFMDQEGIQGIIKTLELLKSFETGVPLFEIESN